MVENYVAKLVFSGNDLKDIVGDNIKTLIKDLSRDRDGLIIKS